jgi:branched-chain amino acid transport system permease protein
VIAEFVMIVVGGLKFGAMYSLAALGIVVIYKATRIVNFAHGAFVLAGAYATYGIVEGINLGYWPAYVLVPIATGLLAAAVELAILRPIRQADMFALIASTIFIGIGLSEVYRLFQNTEMLGVGGMRDLPSRSRSTPWFAQLPSTISAGSITKPVR